MSNEVDITQQCSHKRPTGYFVVTGPGEVSLGMSTDPSAGITKGWTPYFQPVGTRRSWLNSVGGVKWRFLGAGFAWTASQWMLVIPHWVLILVAAPLAAIWLYRLRDWWLHRHGPGHCMNCGYDLRASHNSCPECGASVRANQFSGRAPSTD